MIGFFKSRLPRRIEALKSDAVQLVTDCRLLQEYNHRVVDANLQMIDRIAVRNAELATEAEEAMKLEKALGG